MTGGVEASVMVMDTTATSPASVVALGVQAHVVGVVGIKLYTRPDDRHIRIMDREGIIIIIINTTTVWADAVVT